MRYEHAVWDPPDATGLDIPMVPDVFVVHVAVTEAADIYGPQLGPGGTVAHLYTPLTGKTRQHIDSSCRGYATGGANHRAIAQETAGMGDGPMNAAQVEATALNFACAVVHDGVPNRIATVDNTTGLAWHRLGIRGNFGTYDPDDRRTWSAEQTGENWSSSTGKTCPGDAIIDQIGEIYERAQTLIAELKGAPENPVSNKEAAMSAMVSPVQGTVSQEFKGATVHAGMDIATGGEPRPVYAAFAGTVSHVVRGRKQGQKASSGTVVAQGRSGNGLRVTNPDGETQVYIHVTPVQAMRAGTQVERGELIGHVDLSGVTTGYHLHWEVWDKNGNPTNPRPAFTARGMTPGEKPAASAAKPSASAATAGTPYYARQIDGERGPYTVRAEQTFLADRGYYTRAIDGVSGSYTIRGWQTYLKENSGWYTGVIDGKAGPMTVKALQSWLAKSGHYTRAIDGVAGRYTVRAIQTMLSKNIRKK